MPLKSLEIRNILLFTHLMMEYSNGINILIGENGTGKTSILKILYGACNLTKDWFKDVSVSLLNQYFLNKKNSINYNAILHNINSNYLIEVIDSENGYYHADEIKVECEINNIKTVFIPAKEMLVHSKGFLALNEKYELPFDKTLTDIIVNAELPETREVSTENKKLLDKLAEIIDGIVVYENDTFYVQKTNGRKIEYALEAEGLRKIGLLWKVIRNGLLGKGSVLFWDEPEANLNPQIMPVLVDVLLELQRSGVQIFITTHDYVLLKAFDLRKKNENNVLYHSLYKAGDTIKTVMAKELYDLKPNLIIDTFEKLFDESIEKELEL